MKKYQKISFNIDIKILEKLDKMVEESDDFSVTRTIIINRAIKEYLKHIQEKGA